MARGIIQKNQQNRKYFLSDGRPIYRRSEESLIEVTKTRQDSARTSDVIRPAVRLPPAAPQLLGIARSAARAHNTSRCAR